MMEMSVTATVSGGEQMVVNVGGQEMAVTVPMGIAPGQNFTFQVAAPEPVKMAQPMAVAQPVVAQPVMAQGVMVQPVMPMMAQTQLPHTWARNPMAVTCPNCGTHGVTDVRYDVGGGTWLWCLGIACVGCYGGCCLIPFCTLSSRSNHGAPRASTPPLTGAVPCVCVAA